MFSLGYGGLVQAALRDALRAGDLVVCLALLNSRTSDVPAIAAACGYDAVYVDLEHTSTSLETAALLCSSAIGAGIAGLVRVPSHDPSVIARVLDNGGDWNYCAACQFSQRGAGDRGRRAVPSGGSQVDLRTQRRQWLRAPPGDETDRGARAAHGGVGDDRNPPQAVRACDDIAAVGGIDMILIGPSDLTAEMGIHGQYENEHFHIAVESVAAACRTHGVALGVAGIKSVDLLRRFADLGLQFISAGTDVGMMTEAATARAQASRASGLLRLTGCRQDWRDDYRRTDAHPPDLPRSSNRQHGLDRCGLHQ